LPRTSAASQLFQIYNYIVAVVVVVVVAAAAAAAAAGAYLK